MIPLSLTFLFINFCYILIGGIMKVKVFDEGHEKDLEDDINNFIIEEEPEIFDIKYSVALAISEEQIYCFSALILYK